MTAGANHQTGSALPRIAGWRLALLWTLVTAAGWSLEGLAVLVQDGMRPILARVVWRLDKGYLARDEGGVVVYTVSRRKPSWRISRVRLSAGGQVAEEVVSVEDARSSPAVATSKGSVFVLRQGRGEAPIIREISADGSIRSTYQLSEASGVEQWTMRLPRPCSDPCDRMLVGRMATVSRSTTLRDAFVLNRRADGWRREDLPLGLPLTMTHLGFLSLADEQVIVLAGKEVLRLHQAVGMKGSPWDVRGDPVVGDVIGVGAIGPTVYLAVEESKQVVSILKETSTGLAEAGRVSDVRESWVDPERTWFRAGEKELHLISKPVPVRMMRTSVMPDAGTIRKDTALVDRSTGPRVLDVMVAEGDRLIVLVDVGPYPADRFVLLSETADGWSSTEVASTRDGAEALVAAYRALETELVGSDWWNLVAAGMMAAVALGQWILVRHWVRSWRFWVIVSVGGRVVAAIAATLVGDRHGWYSESLCFAIAVGVGQALAFKGGWRFRVGWVLAWTVGMFFAPLGFYPGLFWSRGWNWEGMTEFGYGAVVGAVTAIPLLRLKAHAAEESL